MADDKIVHRISLEGADDVVKKLKQVGDTGSDAFELATARQRYRFVERSFPPLGELREEIRSAIMSQ
jgi:hypothetical protein